MGLNSGRGHESIAGHEFPHDTDARNAVQESTNQMAAFQINQCLRTNAAKAVPHKQLSQVCVGEVVHMTVVP